MSRLFSVYIRRTLLRTNRACQKMAECSFSYRAHTLMNGPFEKGFMYNVNKQSKIYGLFLPRYESTINAVGTETASSTNSDLHLQDTRKTVDVNDVVPEEGFISEIPEPPVPPSITEEIIDTIKLHANGEPTFSSIGLGGYGPIGLLQYYFEWIHINFDVPWWTAIVLTSFIIKVVSFPLAVDQQRNANRVQNHIPQISALQMKLTNARLCGNREEAVLYGYELQELFKKNKLKMLPVSTYMRIAIHLPVFIALRQMVANPVESMKDGGLYWFKDLTIADPYYLLPLFATLTLCFITEHAFRNSTAVNMSPTMRYMMRGAPAISFLFTMHFQGAILCHWIVSNVMTMLQNIMLKNSKIQAYFNIPPTIEHKKSEYPEGQKNAIEIFKTSWANVKVSNKLANHERADVTQFNAAGKGPLKRTYKHNPVKDPRNAPAVSAMKK